MEGRQKRLPPPGSNSIPFLPRIPTGDRRCHNCKRGNQAWKSFRPRVVIPSLTFNKENFPSLNSIRHQLSGEEDPQFPRETPFFAHLFLFGKDETPNKSLHLLITPIGRSRKGGVKAMTGDATAGTQLLGKVKDSVRVSGKNRLNLSLKIFHLAPIPRWRQRRRSQQQFWKGRAIRRGSMQRLV